MQFGLSVSACPDASAIFARLTLGSFDKLTVDFDSEPLKLLGRRPNGTVVEVGGMSEGTRDQLYLALRLAALDMHLGQAHVLPFIADDLFINYDDERAKAGLEALGEGRGQGLGREYMDWLQIQEVSSKRRSHRLYGIKSQQVHHLLSEEEWKCFLMHEGDLEVVDIREQKPIGKDEPQQP